MQRMILRHTARHRKIPGIQRICWREPWGINGIQTRVVLYLIRDAIIVVIKIDIIALFISVSVHGFRIIKGKLIKKIANSIAVCILIVVWRAKHNA